MSWRLPAMLLVVAAAAACASASQATTTAPVITSSQTTATVPTTIPSTISPSTIPESPTTTADSSVLVVIEVQEGAVEGGGRIDVPLGSEVAFKVTSDVADEVHLHGYDLSFEVGAGAASEFRFTADVPGIFEVELEGSGVPLATLVVAP